MRIVITGTSRGIGKQLAEYYLNGGHLVAGCSRGESTIVNENYLHFSTEVQDDLKVVKMVKEVAKKFNGIDALINNAGIASMNHLMITPVETVKKVFDTNFLGSFIFLREVSKIMKHKNYGRIVNFSTIAKPLNLEGELVYASSKAAIETMTKIAARELSKFNITVNALGPTPIPTDLIKNVPKNKMDALLQRQVINRFCSIEDILNVVDFFISEKSSFITSQIVYLGGC